MWDNKKAPAVLLSTPGPCFAQQCDGLSGHLIERCPQVCFRNHPKHTRDLIALRIQHDQHRLAADAKALGHTLVRHIFPVDIHEIHPTPVLTLKPMNHGTQSATGRSPRGEEFNQLGAARLPDQIT